MQWRPTKDRGLRPTKIVVPPIKFILTNVGKSPAFNVQVFPRAFAMATGHDDLFKEQKEWCGRYRNSEMRAETSLMTTKVLSFFPTRRPLGKNKVASLVPESFNPT